MSARQIVTWTTWTAVEGPKACVCGHEHYGRAPSSGFFMAPQWTWCEDEFCPCIGLQTP